MSPVISLLATTIIIFNVGIYISFMLACIFLGITVFQNHYGVKKNVESNNPIFVYKYGTLTGVPTWKRINGRLVKKFYIVDIENDDYGFTPEKKELDKVKKKLFSVWNRKNGRLVRCSN